MFKDRFEAGAKLAEELVKYKRKEAIVLAIPRGGLQIGFPIAKKLGIPLDIIVTKKIGFPGQPEYAVGSVGPNGHVFLTGREAVPDDYVKAESQRLKKDIEERYKKYRGTVNLPELKGRIIILVDDGLATGSTMMAAVEYVKREKPARIIAAVPVAPPETIERLKSIVDEVICLDTPKMFYAVGQFYESFLQVDDEEAIKLLKEANGWK